MSSLVTALPSRIDRRILVVLLVLFLAGLGVRHAFKVAEGGSAFRRWQPQIRTLQDDVDLSDRFHYPNPPMMAVVLEPFALLPALPGAMLWFALKAGLAVVALVQVCRLVESPGQSLPFGAVAILCLLGMKPIVDDLNHGNVNLFILFLITSFLTLYRQRRDVLAGVILGLAIACKVTPALFIAYLAWKRSWRALGGVALGAVLFIYPGVVPSMRMGFDDHQRQLVSWFRVMAWPYLGEGKVTAEYVNQSLPGVVRRVGTATPAFIRWEGLHPVPVRYVNLAALSHAEARWLVRLCMLLFISIVMWSCRNPREGEPGWPLAAEASIIVLGMLLFSERTWKHHAVTLVLPIAVLVHQLSVGRSSRALRWVLGGLLVAAVLLILLPGLGTTRSRTDAAHAPGMAKLMLAYGAYTWAFVLLLAGQVVLLLRNAPHPRANRLAPDVRSGNEVERSTADAPASSHGTPGMARS